MLSKFMKIIFQDVKNENETKRAAVILRMNSLLMGLYFISLTVVFVMLGYSRAILPCILFLLAYTIPFYCTYKNYTKASALFTQIITLGSILFFVFVYGWGCGIQTFLFAMLILYFTTSHAAMNHKIIYAAVLSVIQLSLYLYAENVQEQLLYTTFSGSVLRAFYMISFFILFMTITSALAFVSKDSMEMEKKLMQYNEKMLLLASLDPLTGLMNRRSTEKYLENQEKKYREGNGSQISLALGDIDFFKNVNDTYGHDCGDLVLKKLADLFLQYMEGKGKVCRWGGEEFLFIFYGYHGDDANILLRTLLSQIRKSEIICGEHKIQVTLTFGLEEIDFRKGIDHAIKEADKKLYLGKSGGRNRIVY